MNGGSKLMFGVMLAIAMPCAQAASTTSAAVATAADVTEASMTLTDYAKHLGAYRVGGSLVVPLVFTFGPDGTVAAMVSGNNNGPRDPYVAPRGDSLVEAIATGQRHGMDDARLRTYAGLLPTMVAAVLGKPDTDTPPTGWVVLVRKGASWAPPGHERMLDLDNAWEETLRARASRKGSGERLLILRVEAPHPPKIDSQG